MAFLSVLQLLKALRHRKPFAVFGNVLQHAKLDIVVFGVGVLILWSNYIVSWYPVPWLLLSL